MSAHDRGKLHFSAKENWLNDPNGMVYFEGEYHLFFQHHPHGMTHGPMYWGHAVSRDLTEWEELDIALFPDEHGMIFSGSAVVDWNDTTGFFGGEPGLVAIFTHHLEREGQPALQTQSLAYSKDRGRTWTKYAGNPVLKHDDYIDFRDPKVLWHEPTSRWVMAVACGDTVCFYASPDLKEWTFGSEFGDGIGSHDGVWECPDLFELAVDGDPARSRWVLLVSIGDAPAVEEGSRTQYFTGFFDGASFVPDAASQAVRWLDGGRDNYAGVTWSDVPKEDGRRLLIGWMSNWKYANLTPTEGFRGAMTLPRELALASTPSGDTLVQRPARELERALVPLLELADAPLAAAAEALAALRLDICLIRAVLPAQSSFVLEVRKGAAETTEIGFDAKLGQLYVDRTRSGRSGFHPQFAGRHAVAAEPADGRIELDIWVDRTSVEVFACGGQAVLTDLIYPSPGSDGFSLSSEDPELQLPSLRVFALELPGRG
ncbi:glycoside hydrolase family 32 protein [Paenibacillus pasadenensis]|uniref:Sucrose-6-phosphate hydrolase n=1 Tax=Paenibacillus pasadenensis TaxID=217090 RepID=A0A2N5N8T7_9BACL|nr:MULTISPECIES: glycoside hydrolase family 32 protein [Paenibacillus]PLT46748.1 Sucrose-6-phosphate hydrolase (EC 3.2.1.B3) [Paenibacillus pasadenensis]QGG57135.1 glycoside hydrolase family 32 protein [Paenibacillus sp. B01]